MNKIPFNIIINATNKGSLNGFAIKWYYFSIERKQTWLKNYKPIYDKYLKEKQLINRIKP